MAAAVEAATCEGGTCQLFGAFGIFVQVMIGVWCVLTLVILWRLEAQRRPFLTWLGDMSKQLIGAGWGHLMNIFFALFLGGALESETMNNQCVWYLVGFLCDIVLVTFLCWWVTSILRPLIRRRCGVDIGEYDSPGDGADAGSRAKPGRRAEVPPWVMWCLQVGIWLAIMTSVKVVVSMGAFLAQDYLYVGLATMFRLAGLCNHQRAQLVTAVIVVPIVGDAFQLAVQDGFLKRQPEPISSDADKPWRDPEDTMSTDWEGSDSGGSAVSPSGCY